MSLVHGGLHCVGMCIVLGNLQLLCCSVTTSAGCNTLVSNNTQDSSEYSFITLVLCTLYQKLLPRHRINHMTILQSALSCNHS